VASGPDLSIELLGQRLQNPVIEAAGTFGEEYSELIDFRKLGALVPKTISLEPHCGSPPPRLVETPAGLLNFVGGDNPGVKKFIEEHLPRWRRYGIPIIVGLRGHRGPDEYVRIASCFKRGMGVMALELNFKFMSDCSSISDTVSRCTQATDLPIIAKLRPAGVIMTEMALAAESGGAAAISLVNTIPAMVIDVERQVPELPLGAGLSGPAIRPIALKMVWDVYEAVKVPVIGMGGVADWRSALEYILAGASAVAVGTAMFSNPYAAIETIDGIRDYMVRHGVMRVTDLVGLAHRNLRAQSALKGGA
jgi:dihydroorotate dehydrogenase (NAD+) catalytic subunit